MTMSASIQRMPWNSVTFWPKATRVLANSTLWSMAPCARPTARADTIGRPRLSASITDLLGAVNARCGGAHPYAFVNTGGTLGTDAIRVQQIYRTGILSPVGSPLSDLDPIHSRPPTAQTYDVVDATNPAFGKRFWRSSRTSIARPPH